MQLPYATGIRLDILSYSEQEISIFLRGEYDLIDGLSPDHSGTLARIATVPSRPWRMMSEVLLPTGDSDFLRGKPGQISGGQAQRVLIALALLPPW